MKKPMYLVLLVDTMEDILAVQGLYEDLRDAERVKESYDNASRDLQAEIMSITPVAKIEETL